MITIQNKQLLINGEPVIIMAGEIHYYRLDKKHWQKAIDELKEAGCNAIATYIPWVCHEYTKGEFDLTGRFNERHDITSFLELCEKNDLYTIVRPGPFVMAEMKNEGIPFWVYADSPELKPIGWDSKPCGARTIDYLNPLFLSSVKCWYKEIMTLASKHLITNGGKIIGVQLDNEIGMLSWIYNCPDLTDYNLSLFCHWLNDKYGSLASERYGFNIEYSTESYDKFRSPSDDIILKYHQDLGYFMRARFAKYVSTLKDYANEYGISGVPLIINIHGSGGSRGLNYPIGLSQLFETYNYSDDFLPGSDFYIGDIIINNFQDVYLANIFTDCMNNINQPLTSMEFEAGDGNYGNNFDNRYSPSAIDIKTRMFIAQGNKLLNYYLFSGGENYRVTNKLHDGNDRIAITGHKHGYAAPIDHNLNRTTTYDKTKQVITTIMTNSDSINTMKEEYDNLVYSFIPDYYMTEYSYPNSIKEKQMFEDIKRVRDGGTWSVLAKSLLLTNHRFKALDIQNKDIVSNIDKDCTLVLTSTQYMSKSIQENVVKYINTGGNIFIYGELPVYDMEGNPCTTLIDYLGVTIDKLYRHTPHLHTSVYPCGFAEGHDEIISFDVQTVNVDNADVFLRVYEDNGVCGFIKEIHNSTIVCMTSPFHSNLTVMKQLFEKVGIKNRLSNDYFWTGIFVTTTKNEKQERFFHIINLDDLDKKVNVFEDNVAISKAPLYLKAKACLMLPQNVEAIPNVLVNFSTAEIYKKSSKSITFRLTQNTDTIIIDSPRQIVKSNEFTIAEEGTKKYISIFSKARLNDYLTINFN